MRKSLITILTLFLTAQNVLAAPIDPQARPLDRAAYDKDRCQTPLTTDIVEPDLPTGQNDRTILQDRLSLPSLWWTRDQYVARLPLGKKLISSWLICPKTANAPQHVQMVLNAQIWSLLEYFDRYEFLNQFGTVTSNNGHDLWIYSDETPVVAAYVCDYQAVSTKLPCKLELNASFSGKRGDEVFPTGN
ncbi:MAG: hypothetical protein HC860_12460 [Alkalinema sp. RU_4_3]|nr:hypothetical protein [Alkalinema sp. RU_4_3]